MKSGALIRLGIFQNTQSYIMRWCLKNKRNENKNQTWHLRCFLNTHYSAISVITRSPHTGEKGPQVFLSLQEKPPVIRNNVVTIERESIDLSLAAGPSVAFWEPLSYVFYFSDSLRCLWQFFCAPMGHIALAWMHNHHVLFSTTGSQFGGNKTSHLGLCQYSEEGAVVSSGDPGLPEKT